MFERLKRVWLQAKAQRKIKKYDKKYRRAKPLLERPPSFHVEDAFDAFVKEFGGQKVSDILSEKKGMPLNADYFFKDHNVIAELKTIEGIYSGPDGPKQLTDTYIEAGYSGSDVMGLLWRNEPIPTDVSQLIRKRIRRSLEQRIKKARKQLKMTKEMFGTKDTKSLILIAMDSDPVFGHETMFGNIVNIMADNYMDEHTDGIVYMTPNTPSTAPNLSMEMSMWIPSYRDEGENSHFVDFVNLLGSGWLKFSGEKIGEETPILQMETEHEVRAVIELFGNRSNNNR